MLKEKLRGNFKVVKVIENDVLIRLTVSFIQDVDTYISILKKDDIYQIYIFNKYGNPITIGRMLYLINKNIPKGLKLYDNPSGDTYSIILGIANRKDWNYELYESTILNKRGINSQISNFYKYNSNDNGIFETMEFANKFKEMIDEILSKHKIPYISKIKQVEGGFQVKVPNFILTRI
jgi:hypothetical protein